MSSRPEKWRDIVFRHSASLDEIENSTLLCSRRCCFSAILRLLGRRSNGHARLTHLEAREAAHSDILAQFADLRGDQLPDADGLVLDEGLLDQADLLVELLHLSGDDLFDNLRWLACRRGLCAIDVL